MIIGGDGLLLLLLFSLVKLLLFAVLLVGSLWAEMLEEVEAGEEEGGKIIGEGEEGAP